MRSDALCGSGRDTGARKRLDDIRATLETTDGVRHVRLAADAGSVLVEYEPGVIDPNALIDAIAGAADLDPPLPDDELSKRRVRPAATVTDAARRLDRLTQDLTGGRADLREVVPMVMTAVAAYSFVTRKDRLPRWDNLVYWAFSIFLALSTSETAETGDRVP